METKHCNGCGQDKPLNSFYSQKTGKNIGKISPRCADCVRISYNAWRRANLEHRREVWNNWAHRTGISRPMKYANDSGPWLGIHIAERVLCNYFEDVTRMPPKNPGFDFICKRGFKIDVKCACLVEEPNRHPRWGFNIRRNQIADYFLCLAFDNRENLTPMHVWLIPGDILNEKLRLSIANPIGIPKWQLYEKPLDKVNMCCDVLRRAPIL